ncbi:MAG: dihydrofolate reductase family protein [Bacteroidia bacterium]|nr:dihydrofolate reductase family protein [Bacteroidia bacterium]
MSKIVLYIATTIDGKIARSDGSLDWLESLPNPNQLDYGYSQLLSSIEATIMGKNTYNTILGFGVDWPYKDIPSYVVTSNAVFKPKTPDTFSVTTPLAAFVSGLKSKCQKDIWLIGGGQLVASFLNQNLLDKMILTVIPITIGDGIPLFPNGFNDTKWNLTQVESFETGVVNLTYER